MGCSSSREALRCCCWVELPDAAPAERRPPQARLLSRSLKALSSSLDMCCRRRRNGGGAQQAYAKLRTFFTEEEEPAPAVKGRTAAHCPALALPGEEGADVEAAFAGADEGAPSPTSSWSSAPWQPESALSPLHDAADLWQGVEDYRDPERDDCLVPPETVVVVVDRATPPAARDVPEVVVTGIVRARVNQFHEQMEIKKKKKKKKAAVVVYFTSLRGVRRTFEDGLAVRAILQSYRVRLDERDVSMHAAFRSELRDLLLAGGVEGPAALPRVFVVDNDGRRRDLGGAEEVRALHEAGELARVLAGCCEAAAPAPAADSACAACGGVRFAVCRTCHGSCKVFVDDGGEVCRLAGGGFRRCPDCNENGLIRCPACCVTEECF